MVQLSDSGRLNLYKRKSHYHRGGQNKRRKTKKRRSNKKRNSFKSWGKNIREYKTFTKNRKKQEYDSDELVREKLGPRDSLIPNSDPYNWQIQTSPYATSSMSETAFERKVVSLRELCIRKIADNAIHLDAQVMEEIPETIGKDIWNTILRYQCESYQTFMNFCMKFSKKSWFTCWCPDTKKYPDSMFLGLRREVTKFDQRHRLFPLFNELVFHRFVNSLNAHDIIEKKEIVQTVEIRKKITRDDLNYLIHNAKYLKCLKIDRLNEDLITSQFIYSLCQCLYNGKLASLEMISLPIKDESQVLELQKVSTKCSLRYIEISSGSDLHIRRQWKRIDSSQYWTLIDDMTSSISYEKNMRHQKFLRNYNPFDSWGVKVAQFNSLAAESLALIIHFILTPLSLNLDLEKTTPSTVYEEYDQLWNIESYHNTEYIPITSRRRFDGNEILLSNQTYINALYLHDFQGYKRKLEKEKETIGNSKKNPCIAFSGIKKKPVIKKYVNMDSYFD